VAILTPGEALPALAILTGCELGYIRPHKLRVEPNFLDHFIVSKD